MIPIFLSLFQSHVVPSGATFSTLNVRAAIVFVLLSDVYSSEALTSCPALVGVALLLNIIQSLMLSFTRRNSFLSSSLPLQTTRQEASLYQCRTSARYVQSPTSMASA